MLIQSLIEGGRSFTKTLRHDIPEEATIAAANLKDVGAEGVALFLDDGLRADALRQALEDCPIPTWVWHILAPMPPFPKARLRAKEPEPTPLANQLASVRLGAVSIGFIRLAGERQPSSAFLPGRDSSSGRIELRRPPPCRDPT